MWIARDKRKNLMFWDCEEKPKRVCEMTWACDNNRGVGYLTNTDSIDISWNDEPKKVSIVLDDNIEKMFDCIEEYFGNSETECGTHIDREFLKGVLLNGNPEIGKPLYSVGENVFVNESGESLPGIIVGVAVENGRHVYSVEVSLTVGDYPDVFVYEEKDITTRQ